ncbi:MAG: hypothetical protein ABEK01_03665 [Candidatus Nanohaloarchaea archaeon]
MKFELFGRLRDNDENQDGENGSSGDFESSSSELTAGELEQTVEDMFSQGYSEEEIKQELSGQYSETEINRAINNTVTASATAAEEEFEGGPEPMTPYEEDQEDEAVSPMDEGYGGSENSGQETGNMNNPPGPGGGSEQQGMGSSQPPVQQDQGMQQTNPARQNQSQSGSRRSGGGVDAETEELIETIVAEYFDRVQSKFDQVYEELDLIEEEMENLESRVHDLEVRDDEDQEQFVQKLDEVEEHIDSYESRIGGLEKAFQQVLPSLVDNVRDLTDLVQEIKRERGMETETSVSSQDMEDVDMEEMEDW